MRPAAVGAVRVEGGAVGRTDGGAVGGRTGPVSAAAVRTAVSAAA
ncbi:hypothetical protein [Streptomyces sp. NPDC001089]